MADTTDIRKGLTLLIHGQPCTVLEHQFVKPGKGQAFIRTKLKQLQTGTTLEKTFRSGEKIHIANTEHHTIEYLFQEGDGFIFMDHPTYEHIRITREQLGSAVYYLTENMVVDVIYLDGNPIDIQLPTFVEIQVTDTEPGYKGDTTSGGTKPATLETGLEVRVPLFIQVGNTIKVDTRTGTYVERVS